ncbi:MAG TPA: hypothetical protein VFN35_18600 [Ktedonobacteraceae bacterium]|nr:hypothetical protein [Ktedonobacteraceae bacterium]
MASTVNPTKVPMVSAAKTPRTLATAPTPMVLAARATGRMVRSGDAATPKGIRMAASPGGLLCLSGQPESASFPQR